MLLHIDEELRNIAPPVKDYELRLLEADIMIHGCLTPLIVWNGTIVDGHNRYAICQKHGIPFEVEEIPFRNKSEAKCWIVTNALGRRNLSPFSRCEMVLRCEKELKEKAERRRRENIGRTQLTGVPSQKEPKTRQLLGNMAGVSEGTLEKAKYINIYGDEETKRRLRDGEISIHFAFTTLRRSEPKRSSAEILRDVKYLVSGLSEDIVNGKADLDDAYSILSEISAIIERGT